MFSGWWVHQSFESAGGGTDGAVVVVAWIVWVLASITLHELGHGWAAISQGDRTPIEMGHMSASPMVHMGGMSMIVFFLIGIAWGLMPVDPSRFRNQRWGRVIVALAGPAVNLVLFLVCAIALGILIAVSGEVDAAGKLVLDSKSVRYAWFILFLGAKLNLVLLVFNLLPVPPLDGWQALAGLSYRIRMLMHHPNAPMFGLGFLLLLLVSGAFDSIWRLADAASMKLALSIAGMF